MKTVVEIPATKVAIFRHLTRDEADLLPDFEIGDIDVRFYAEDDRIKWTTYIVTILGNAVGFTNGPVK